MPILPAAVLPLLAAFVAAQTPLAVELELPSQTITVPLAAGQNLVFTAKVEGKPKVVFVARKAADADRVVLKAASTGRYQINLADPQIEALLLAPVARRAPTPSFVVAAEDADGNVVASTPVRYALAKGRDAPELVQVMTQGPPLTEAVEWWRSDLWCTPSMLKELQLRFGDEQAEAPRAKIGERSLIMAKEGNRAYILPITDELRAQWQAAGVVQLEVTGPSHRVFELRARPLALTLPTDPAPFKVMQRAAATVPGSNSYMHVSLGDITQGHVQIEMWDAEGRRLIEDRTMQQGQLCHFPFAGKDYVLVVAELVNKLIGHDWAILQIATKEPDLVGRIDAVLTAVENSPHDFVRNGVEQKGPVAAAFLRAKYGKVDGHLHSFAEFVTEVATKSASGEEYQVRIDGKLRPLAEWLTETDAALQAAGRKAGAGK